MAVLRPALLFRFVWVIYLRYNLAEKEQKYTKFYKKKENKMKCCAPIIGLYLWCLDDEKSNCVFCFSIRKKSMAAIFLASLKQKYTLEFCMFQQMTSAAVNT